MLKNLFFSILFFLFTIICSLSTAYAAEDFATSYDVVYDIDESGVTTVAEKITLKNLTSKFYATYFERFLGSTQITDLKATDSSGALGITSSQKGTGTNLNIKFNQQVVGLGKELDWTLQYKTSDFAIRQGKIWQILIPKLSTKSQQDNYKITLSAPLDFGEPALITPVPKSQATHSGKMFLTFDKSELQDAGVSAIFGSNLVYDFSLTYRLQNDSLLPILTHIALPPDTQYQDVIFQRIEPQPINVTVDEDGNYLAWYRLSRNQKLDVLVVGSSKLYAKSKTQSPYLPDNLRQKYLMSTKYWEADNPAIKAKLAEILKGNEEASQQQKAKLIYKYVVNSLKYDPSRVKNSNERFGAVTALNNPTTVACLEFTDLFIAFSRAAGIPARELDGFAYTTNPNLRPLSLGEVLHAWPEYFDPTRGWVMVDPTWENTTAGVDYFNRLDLNHFVFAVKGTSSTSPIAAGSYKLNKEGDVKVMLSEMDFLGKAQAKVDINIDDEIVAGFPGQFKVTVANQGNAAANFNDYSLSTQQISILNPDQKLGVVPPFGYVDLQYQYRTKTFFDRFNDDIEVLIGGQKFGKEVNVKPFFVFTAFPLALALIIASMLGLYFSILGVLIYRRRVKKKRV